MFSNGPTVVTNGLVLALDAGDRNSYPGSGTTWFDLTGVNNGTLVNGPTFNTGSGGSIVFDGVDDWVSLSTGSSTSFTDNFSLSVWINISGYPSSTYGGIVGRFTANGGYSGYILAIRPNNKFGFEIANNGTTVLCYSDNTISLNTWYNVVAIKENGTNKIYVNSVLQTDTNTQSLSTSATVPLIIGRYYSNVSNFYWPGKLPVVQIYNRALSAQEVLQNYNATKGRFGL